VRMMVRRECEQRGRVRRAGGKEREGLMREEMMANDGWKRMGKEVGRRSDRRADEGEMTANDGRERECREGRQAGA